MLNSLVLHTRKFVAPHTAKGWGVNTGGVASSFQVTVILHGADVVLLQVSTAL